MKKLRTPDPGELDDIETPIDETDELQTASEQAPRAPRVELDLSQLEATIGGLTATTSRVIQLIEGSTGSPGPELLAELEALRKAAVGAHFGFEEASAGEEGYGRTTEREAAARLCRAVDNLHRIAVGTHPFEVRGLGMIEIPNLERADVRAAAVRAAKAILGQIKAIEREVRRTADQVEAGFAKRMEQLQLAYRIPVLRHMFDAVEILCQRERPARNIFALSDVKSAIRRSSRAYGLEIQVRTLYRDISQFREWSARQKAGS